MQILVLGGTQFVGRHMVQALLERGHNVTTFTRGQTADSLPPEVLRLYGDRSAGELSSLQGRTWDACLDVSGYLPRVVEQSARLLERAVKRYLFISTVSVYADGQAEPITEDSALEVLPDAASENIPAHYGALKVVCEERVRAIYGERATIVRPGLVAGPHDHTGRFTYWAMRAARAGVALAPGDGQDPIQVIDARDLAEFTAHLLERATPGTFNAVGEPLHYEQFLDGLAAALGTHPQWRWLPEAQAVAEGLPIYSPRDPVLGIVPARAKAAGLKLRPLADTARDTLAWTRAELDAPGARGSGPSLEREAEVLAGLS
ncbi:NAD-dependent epimerase/dehydratase family protein [Deinococcus sp.]|uniref:NAD-dependent epimerase/dehydratase family protein n=1 Tax=Deinococcus sp. TaxID=47478 RepID=UPI0025D37EB5|nr:NAD-dependent epimerase/dehydratase family protein [Deinococcus sp.]